MKISLRRDKRLPTKVHIKINNQLTRDFVVMWSLSGLCILNNALKIQRSEVRQRSNIVPWVTDLEFWGPDAYMV